MSRVGGAAQTKVIKKLGGSVRLALAQYRELAAFAQFASDLDEVTRKQLERGTRVMELMKQKQYAPLSIANMAASLYAAEKGYLDSIPVDRILPFEAGLHQYLAVNCADLVNKLNEKGDWNNDLEAALKAGTEAFKKSFA